MKTIGIKLADGSFYPILNEGTPDKKTLDLTTAKDNQTTVMVDLYRSETGTMEDAEYVVIGFGTAGRIALSAVRAAREQGHKIGLLRPISLSPFPTKAVDELADRVKGFLVVEMSNGQMLDDITSIVARRVPVEFYGRMGGMVPYPDEIASAINDLVQGEHDVNVDARGKWLAKMRELVGTGE